MSKQRFATEAELIRAALNAGAPARRTARELILTVVEEWPGDEAERFLAAAAAIHYRRKMTAIEAAERYIAAVVGAVQKGKRRKA